jgi:hypothetical protein
LLEHRINRFVLCLGEALRAMLTNGLVHEHVGLGIPGKPKPRIESLNGQVRKWLKRRVFHVIRKFYPRVKKRRSLMGGGVI